MRRPTSRRSHAVAAGHIDFAFAEAGASRGLIQDGKLRALAVSTSRRIPSLPEVPAFAEVSGMRDFDIGAWHVLVVGSETPPQIVGRLNAEMKAITATAEMQKRMSGLGLIPREWASVADTQRTIESETAKWRTILDAIGLSGTQ